MPLTNLAPAPATRVDNPPPSRLPAAVVVPLKFDDDPFYGNHTGSPIRCFSLVLTAPAAEMAVIIDAFRTRR